jgi:hypothetical protein
MLLTAKRYDGVSTGDAHYPEQAIPNVFPIHDDLHVRQVHAEPWKEVVRGVEHDLRSHASCGFRDAETSANS